MAYVWWGCVRSFDERLSFDLTFIRGQGSKGHIHLWSYSARENEPMTSVNHVPSPSDGGFGEAVCITGQQGWAATVSCSVDIWLPGADGGKNWKTRTQNWCNKHISMDIIEFQSNPLFCRWGNIQRYFTSLLHLNTTSGWAVLTVDHDLDHPEVELSPFHDPSLTVVHALICLLYATDLQAILHEPEPHWSRKRSDSEQQGCKQQFNIEKGMYAGAIGAIISLNVAETNQVKEEYVTTLIAQTGSCSTQVAVRTQGALHKTAAGPGCSYFGSVLWGCQTITPLIKAAINTQEHSELP